MLVEPEDPLTTSERAQLAVEQLRERGWTFRRIARECGISVEAVHRSASGVGRIRQSTEEVLVTVAATATARQRALELEGGLGHRPGADASVRKGPLRRGYV